MLPLVSPLPLHTAPASPPPPSAHTTNPPPAAALARTKCAPVEPRGARTYGPTLHHTYGPTQHRTYGPTLHHTYGPTLHHTYGPTLHRTYGPILHRTRVCCRQPKLIFGFASSVFQCLFNFGVGSSSSTFLFGRFLWWKIRFQNS